MGKKKGKNLAEKIHLLRERKKEAETEGLRKLREATALSRRIRNLTRWPDEEVPDLRSVRIDGERGVYKRLHRSFFTTGPNDEGEGSVAP